MSDADFVITAFTTRSDHLDANSVLVQPVILTGALSKAPFHLLVAC